ncbi:MAG: SDR family NAD(P)-dependent oxidoreductase [Actinobacteria bacterium]|nr:SDR family NAD(P)-dependent oxidoreductase [Actinomycetota bacterium]
MSGNERHSSNNRTAGPISEESKSKGCIVATVSRAHLDDASHVTADLRSPEAAATAIADVVARHGSVDIVINAMGVVAFGPINTTSVDTIEELFLTNTFGHIFLMQAALQNMKTGSVLVGISGVIAEQNLPGMSVYGASKAATRSFNEALSREARRSGIRVIDARPPHTETGLASRAIAGTPPKFPAGLEPVQVGRRIVQAIADGETDLPSGAFAP